MMFVCDDCFDCIRSINFSAAIESWLSYASCGLSLSSNYL